MTKSILTGSSDALKVNEFIEKIASEAGNGREFCPLLGSGISHPSGIMIGRGFTSYLAYTFCRCVLSASEQMPFGLQKNHGQRDLRAEGWPAFPKPEQLNKAQQKIFELFRPLRGNSGTLGKEGYRLLSRPLVPECLKEDYQGIHADDNELVKEWRKEDKLFIIPYWENHHGEGVKRILTEERFRPRRAQHSQQEILNYGISCLADWRATLNFLARLKVERSGGKIITLSLSEKPELRLVDSFSAHLGLGKKPNLNHMMIAHLARMLRMQVLLTTNFDTLLEDAFVSARQPLQVIPVSLVGGLPSPATVRARRTLLKLHGTQHETRADWSLDETPSTRDVGAFIEYLHAGGREGGGVENRANDEAPRHLLVLGFSGLDVRVMDYLRAALILHPDLYVFWVANSENTNWEMLRGKLGLSTAEARRRLHITVTAHTDLLLYELYQRLGKYLPPSGFSYQFSLNVPAWVEKVTPAGSENLLYQALEKRKLGLVLGLKEGTGAEIDKSRVLRFDSGVRASESVGLLYADAVKERKNCMWLELEDFSSAKAVGTVILHNIAYRLGLFSREHVDLSLFNSNLGLGHGQFAGLCRHLQYLTDRYFDTSASEWMIFIYGRCVPASCAGWIVEEAREWDKVEWKRLLRLLAAFSRVGYRMILMPQSGNRIRYLDKQNQMLQAVLQVSPPVLRTQAPLEEWEINIDSSGIKNKGIITLASVAEWLHKDWTSEVGDRNHPDDDNAVRERLLLAVNSLKENPDAAKVRFLYALTLFRQSRHPASLVSEGVFSCPHRFNTDRIDNDAYRFERTRQWIEELAHLKVFFRKDGGYLWMYGDIRQHLRFILETVRIGEMDGGKVVETQQITRKAKTHYWIAEWYFFAFLSSGHSDPLVESLYHRMQAIHHLSRETKGRQGAGEDTEATYRLELLHASLCKLSKTLFVARHKIATWAQSLHANDVFNKDDIGAALGCPNMDVDGGSIFKDSLRRWIGGNVSQLNHTGILNLCREIIDQVAYLQLVVGKSGDNLTEWSPLSPVGGDGLGGLFTKIPSSDPAQEGLAEGHAKYINEIYWGEFQLDADGLGSCPIFNIRPEAVINGGAVKTARQAIVNKLLSMPRRLLTLAHVMRMHAYFIYKHANLAVRVARIEGNVEGEGGARPLYLKCTAFCRIALEVLAHLPAAFAHEDNALRYELHILYGIALANLDRFQEAKRRLTEADYLTHVMEVEVIAEKRGVLHLRRAEVDMLQARYYGRLEKGEGLSPGHRYSTDELLSLGRSEEVNFGIPAQDIQTGAHQKRLSALRTAKVNDCVAELDAAEASLTGNSRSNLWRHKLYTLRLLSIASEDPEQVCSMTCRQPLAPLELMRHWFEQGLFLTARDAYRRLQIYDAYRQALDCHFRRQAKKVDRFGKRESGALEKIGIKNEIEPYLFRLKNSPRMRLESSQELPTLIIRGMLDDGNKGAWNSAPIQGDFRIYAQSLSVIFSSDFTLNSSV